MNNQNQNTSLGQSAAGGLQSGALSQPTSSNFQQSSANTFGADTSATGLNLNQSGPTRVLSSTTVKSDDAGKITMKASDGFPAVGVIIILVALVVLGWFLFKKLEEN